MADLGQVSAHPGQLWLGLFKDGLKDPCISVEENKVDLEEEKRREVTVRYRDTKPSPYLAEKL